MFFSIEGQQCRTLRKLSRRTGPTYRLATIQQPTSQFALSPLERLWRNDNEKSENSRQSFSDPFVGLIHSKLTLSSCLSRLELHRVTKSKVTRHVEKMMRVTMRKLRLFMAYYGRNLVSGRFDGLRAIWASIWLRLCAQSFIVQLSAH